MALMFLLLALAPVAAWLHLLSTHWIAVLASIGAGVASWLGGLLAQVFWRPLADLTLRFSHVLLARIYPTLDYDPSQGLLGTGSFLVEIAPECSGYEGIALVTVFVALYLWIFRKSLSFPRAFLLFPVGIAAIWLANVLRITALIVIGTSISPEVAVGGFHSQAGWISFTLIALGLIAISHRLRLSARSHTSFDIAAPEQGSVAVALLAPLLALMATSMLTSAMASGLDAFYPLGVIVTAAVLWRFRHAYGPINWSWSWQPVAIGAAVFAIWMFLEPSSMRGDRTLAARLSDWPAWLALAWILFRIIGSVVTVPIAEELAFRGYLTRKLVDRDFQAVPLGRFTWLSFVGSSVLFGLLHNRLLAGTLAGAGFALALYHRGRLGDAIVAHATSNALIAIAVVIGGQWGLWT
jgi:exosortase E/protease (VPEID-CTERM system)